MSAIQGCCAGRFLRNIEVKDINSLANTFISQINVIEYDLGNPAIEVFRQAGASIVEIDKIVIVTWAGADGLKIRNKPYYDEHKRLQARDGRKTDEFKPGDFVIMIGNPTSRWGGRPMRIAEKQDTVPTGSFWVEMYDSYYSRWNMYSTMRASQLLRVEK